MERKKNHDIKLELQNQFSQRDQQLIKCIKKQQDINQNTLELTKNKTDSAEKQNLMNERIVYLIQRKIIGLKTRKN